MAERIEGMDDLLKSLENLTLREGEQILAKSLRNAAKLLAEEQEHLVPRDTGNLAANIKVKITERSATECIARIGPSRKAFYAQFQNWGVRNSPGRHFIERAFDNKITEVHAVIRYDLGRFIDKAMKKHG